MENALTFAKTSLSKTRTIELSMSVHACVHIVSRHYRVLFTSVCDTNKLIFWFCSDSGSLF